MSRLKDIAEKAGVSISVVSRTLNPKPDRNAYVSDKLRRKITKVAVELGYRRNRMAEFLKRGKNATIGVFIPEEPNRLVADLMFGISLKAAELDFPLSFHFGKDRVEYGNFIKSVSVSSSGIITYPFNLTHDLKTRRILDDFIGGGGHVVVLNSYDKLEVPVLYIDDEYGGRIAGEYLLGKKCRTYMVSSSGYEKRKKGFKDAIRSGGGSIVELKDSSFDDSIRTEQGRGNGKPIGIFATTDVLAMDIMSWCQDNSVRIGRDVLIVGYDDLYLTSHLNPPLTTIHQPFKRLGEMAVGKIVGMIYGGEEKNEHILPYLVKRGSA